MRCRLEISHQKPFREKSVSEAVCLLIKVRPVNAPKLVDLKLTLNEETVNKPKLMENQRYLQHWGGNLY